MVNEKKMKFGKEIWEKRCFNGRTSTLLYLDGIKLIGMNCLVFVFLINVVHGCCYGALFFLGACSDWELF